MFAASTVKPTGPRMAPNQQGSKKMKDVKCHDLVTCSTDDDAPIYRVLAVDGFNVRMADASVDVQPQNIDRDLLLRPSLKQLDRYFMPV